MEDKTHNPSAKITGYSSDGILVLPPAFHGIKKKQYFLSNLYFSPRLRLRRSHSAARSTLQWHP